MLFGQLFITDKRNNLACPLKSYQCLSERAKRVTQLVCVDKSKMKCASMETKKDEKKIRNRSTPIGANMVMAMVNIVTAINRVVKTNASKRQWHSLAQHNHTDNERCAFNSIHKKCTWIYFICLRNLPSTVGRVSEWNEKDKVRMTGRGIPLLTGTL